MLSSRIFTRYTLRATLHAEFMYFACNQSEVYQELYRFIVLSLLVDMLVQEKHKTSYKSAIGHCKKRKF